MHCLENDKFEYYFKRIWKIIDKEEMIILWGCRRLEAETVSSVFFPDDYVFEHFEPP